MHKAIILAVLATGAFGTSSGVGLDSVFHDVGVVRILCPVGFFSESTWVWPQLRVANFGDTAESFEVGFQIGLWTDSVQVERLAPGDSLDVTMSVPWLTELGTWTSVGRSYLRGDMNPENDVACDTFWVARHQVDITLYPVAPRGVIDTSMVVPVVTARNGGLHVETFWCYFDVYDPGGRLCYAESAEATVYPGGADTLVFPDARFTTPGPHQVMIWAWMDSLMWTFDVVPGCGVEECAGGRMQAKPLCPTVMRAVDLVRMDCRVLDIMGRDVTEWKALLAPGVYFVLRASGVERVVSSVHKVVIQR
jgi:hypothetical protein